MTAFKRIIEAFSNKHLDKAKLLDKVIDVLLGSDFIYAFNK